LPAAGLEDTGFIGLSESQEIGFAMDECREEYLECQHLASLGDLEDLPYHLDREAVDSWAFLDSLVPYLAFSPGHSEATDSTDVAD
jgi:hypothetical protein